MFLLLFPQLKINKESRHRAFHYYFLSKVLCLLSGHNQLNDKKRTIHGFPTLAQVAGVLELYPLVFFIIWQRNSGCSKQNYLLGPYSRFGRKPLVKEIQSPAFLAQFLCWCLPLLPRLTLPASLPSANLYKHCNVSVKPLARGGGVPRGKATPVSKLKSPDTLTLEYGLWLPSHNRTTARFPLDSNQETLSTNEFKLGSGRVLQTSSYLWVII